MATAKTTKAAETKTTKATETKTTKAAPKTDVKIPTQKMRVDTSKAVMASMPKVVTPGAKTVYHVSKRDRDGREWKVFIQESDKVIKLFATQAEALDYAKSLVKNKASGSYVVLHGLDGKIRRF